MALNKFCKKHNQPYADEDRCGYCENEEREEAKSPPVGRHPWADDSGKITPKSAATAVTNMILLAGGKASTAFACGFEIAKDFERRQEGNK